MKKIEVLDGYIEIDLISCSSKLDDFARMVDGIASRLETKEGGLDEEKTGRILAEKFDAVFGRRSCQKTFGTDTPGILQFAEFWDKFSPLLEEWLKE